MANTNKKALADLVKPARATRSTRTAHVVGDPVVVEGLAMAGILYRDMRPAARGKPNEVNPEYGKPYEQIQFNADGKTRYTTLSQLAGFHVALPDGMPPLLLAMWVAVAKARNVLMTEYNAKLDQWVEAGKEEHAKASKKKAGTVADDDDDDDDDEETVTEAKGNGKPSLAELLT